MYIYGTYHNDNDSHIRNVRTLNLHYTTFVINGGRPKFRHINTPLHLMVPPWRASLHKLPMAVGKTSAMPWPLFNNTVYNYAWMVMINSL